MKKKTILIVDDEELIRELLSKYFKDYFNVTTAPDGEDAVPLVSSVDLVITDINMPKMTGLELKKHIPDSIPTIFISGYMANTSLNLENYIEKPFSLKQLHSKINELLKLG